MKSSKRVSATAMCLLAAFLSAVMYGPVAALPTKAKQALVVDYTTHAGHLDQKNIVS